MSETRENNFDDDWGCCPVHVSGDHEKHFRIRGKLNRTRSHLTQIEKFYVKFETGLTQHKILHRRELEVPPRVWKLGKQTAASDNLFQLILSFADSDRREDSTDSLQVDKRIIRFSYCLLNLHKWKMNIRDHNRLQVQRTKRTSFYQLDVLSLKLLNLQNIISIIW